MIFIEKKGSPGETNVTRSSEYLALLSRLKNKPLLPVLLPTPAD
jgi:hypothetical protein